jgi:TolB-like protein
MASKEISDSLSSDTTVVIVNFSSPSGSLSDYVIEEMALSLLNLKRLTVVDRQDMDFIRKEMNFQMSGDVSDESAQRIGKILGAKSIISGSIIEMGNLHRFRTKVINVESAEMETSTSVSIKNDKQVKYLLSQSNKKNNDSNISRSTKKPDPSQTTDSQSGGALNRLVQIGSALLTGASRIAGAILGLDDVVPEGSITLNGKTYQKVLLGSVLKNAKTYDGADVLLTSRVEIANNKGHDTYEFRASESYDVSQTMKYTGYVPSSFYMVRIYYRLQKGGIFVVDEIRQATLHNDQW